MSYDSLSSVSERTGTSRLYVCFVKGSVFTSRKFHVITFGSDDDDRVRLGQLLEPGQSRFFW